MKIESSRARIAMGLALAVIACSALRTLEVLGAPCAPGAGPSSGATTDATFSVSVRDAPYGAKGNAVDDDTAPIQRALDDAGAFLVAHAKVKAKATATVFVPAGAYLVRTHLTVPSGVVLAGIARSPGEASPTSGSVLHAVEGANDERGTPFVTLAARATLRGVTVYYPQQIDRALPVAYPWAIRAAGEQVSIVDVALTNPWQGIDLASHPTAGHLVQRVFGQAIKSGIVIDHSTGGGRLEDVHFWPFWRTSGSTPTRQFTAASGVAFEFRFAVGEVVQGVLEIGYAVGMRFVNSPQAECLTALPCGASSGTMTDINFDTTGVSLDIASTDEAGWAIDGMNAVGDVGTYPIPIWHHPPLRAKMAIRNAAFWGGHAAANGDWIGLYQILRWDGDGEVSLSSSNLTRQNPHAPAVDIRAGTAVIDGNFFGEGAGVAIASSGTASVTATANQMVGNTVSGPVKLVANAQ